MYTTDVYRLAVRPFHWNLAFGFLTLFSLFGVGLVVVAVRSSAAELPGLPMAVLFCAAMAWNWYVLLTMPYEIRFESADRIIFRALARTTTVNVESLRSIKPLAGGGGIYVVRHDNGKIRLLAQFTGFHEVVTRIKAVHPGVEVVGI
jgi:hypothetical protein